MDANEDPNERQLEASEAYELFNAGGTSDPYEQLIVVIGGAPGATTDPAFQAVVGGVVSKLQATSAPLDGVQTPAFSSWPTRSTAPPTAGLVSADGSTVRIIGRVDGERPRTSTLLAPVLPLLAETRAANPGLAVHAISSTFINDDITRLIDEGLDQSLRITIPLTFVILLFAFGAIVASVVPLVLAITSLVAAFGILGIYSQLVGPVSPNATQLIVLIGLAVAVDYSLFMITRFRVERRAGRDRAKAIEVSSSTAGRAVFFSGLAVMISLAGLITLGVSLFTSMAIGTISVVLRLGRREPDVPAGDPCDPRRQGEPRASGGVVAAPGRGPPAWPDLALGTVRDRLARSACGTAGGQRFLGPAGDLGHGPSGAHDHPVYRVAAGPGGTGPATADGDHRHHRLPGLDRRRCRDQAPQREVAGGYGSAAGGRGHAGRPAGDRGGDRATQDATAWRSTGSTNRSR